MEVGVEGEEKMPLDLLVRPDALSGSKPRSADKEVLKS